MKTRIPLLVLAGTVLALVGGPLAAQQAGSQPPQRADLTAVPSAAAPVVAAVRAAPSDQSVIVRRWQTQPARPSGRLDALRAPASLESRGRHSGSGAILGALIGGGIGVLVGVHQRDVCNPGLFCGAEVPLFGLIGAGLGAMLGAIMGAGDDFAR